MINLEIRYKYIGNGQYIFGIPARDLTARDLLEFNLDEKELEKSPLYSKVKIVEKIEIVEKETTKKRGK